MQSRNLIKSQKNTEMWTLDKINTRSARLGQVSTLFFALFANLFIIFFIFHNIYYKSQKFELIILVSQMNWLFLGICYLIR